MVWSGLKCHQPFQGLCCPASAPSSGPCLRGRMRTGQLGRGDIGHGFMPRHLSKGRAAVGLWDRWGADVSGGSGGGPCSQKLLHPGQLLLGQVSTATSTWELLCQAKVWARPWLAGHFVPFSPRGTSQSLQLGQWLRETRQGCAVSYIVFQSSLYVQGSWRGKRRLCLSYVSFWLMFKSPQDAQLLHSGRLAGMALSNPLDTPSEQLPLSIFHHHLKLLGESG